MVDEMIKLRKLLDKKGIKWKDKSERHKFEYGGEFFFDRTLFEYNGQEVGVINGNGTYGGVDVLTNKNEGLLEFCGCGGEPIGYLTADEVMNELEKRNEN